MGDDVEGDDTEGDDTAGEWADRKVSRASEMLDRHGTVFRWMWIAVGFIVIAAGLAMIVFPGPVTVVVPLGLVMLAAVFGWARRLLLRSVDTGAEAAERFKQASMPVKVLAFAASACVAGAIVAWFVL